ncbi:MAG: calcium/sodium antiporter [Gemmatimonadota bacterium]|nr:MAG: calcium/sodium antiporter [Gemmatimonadota bacterium]
MDYIQLLGGLVYLLMGGDFLVRGAVALARRAHVSPLIVGLTVVSFGTSLPELVVSVQAVLAGYTGMAIGNVVGSNIANVLLVAGAPAIAYPLVCDRGFERHNASIMLGASIFFVVLCLVGELNQLAGVVLLTGFVAIMAYTLWAGARARRGIEQVSQMEWVLGLPNKTSMISLFIAVGAVGLPVGARLMVEAAVGVSAQLGISDAVIGLTIVAVGTSLPELATAFVAVVRRETEVAVGTVTGSCVFNILAIMGVATLVSRSPIPVPGGFATLDLPVMLGAAFALALLVWFRRSIGRAAGIAFVAGYCAYLVALVGGA